jgi:Tol biopolymer transport system component
MTPANDFDRTLSAWLHECAEPQAPEHLREAAVAHAVATRPRPAWRIPERWLPMPITLRLAVVPRAVLLLLMLALLVALAAGSLAVGSRLNLFATVALPAPVGPAGNGLIAYSVAGDIWVVDPDGTDARPLISGPAFDGGPHWSPDGSRLAYWSRDSESASELSLVVANADGSSPVTVATHDRSDDVEGVAWSPDGARLAYNWCRPTPSCVDDRVVVANTDGSGNAAVGNPSLRAWGPDWSPDGSLIAFGGGLGGDKGVYLMKPDGSDARRISQVMDVTENSFISVGWSPDGTRIVSQADPTPESYHLWLFAADGTEESEVAGTPPDSILPDWSPDGSRISFFVAEGSERHLSVIPADGGEVTRLASDVENGWSWSPDGTQILGTRPTGLVVLDATTGSVVWELAQPPEAIEAGVDASWQRDAS